jgi:DNA-binding SARP family transcriptional activator/predicted ATPase
LSRLKLSFLGPPQVELDGEQVSFDTRKAVALLAYLACERRPHSRETLATLFWPEYEAGRAFHNLRRSLWSINKALGKGWLESDSEQVALGSREELWLDVEAFRGEASAEPGAGPAPAEILRRWAAAAELYRDDFLAGMSLPDSPSYDEWQFFQREGLRADFARLLERLVKGSLEEGDFEGGIRHARRWLALDSLHEPAHQALMRLYALTGQRSAALRQYELCARVLEQELGVEPQPETTALYEQIRTGAIRPADKPPVESPEEAGAPISVVEEAALAGSEPPARQGQPVPNNLPHDLTPFVGRQAELDELDRLLSEPGLRLLTLLGPGGIGKTRLALAAAQRFATERATGDHPPHELPTDRHGPDGQMNFPDGVFFVPLAPVVSAEHILPALAQGLEFSFYRSGDLFQQLSAYLQGRRMLILLDNFEHLISRESTELILKLLADAPGVTILTTSRASLSVRGEQIFSVLGLHVPEAGRIWQDRQELELYSAVHLFVQSARRAQPSFELTEENLPLAVRICQLVQGMPLGLELAAAWVALLPLEEIAVEIERSLDFLASELRDLPERQRSLRAVFEATWNLLNEAERAAFKKLSVFRGGFTRQAAQEVSGASLRSLASLASQALLVRVSQDRYEIHELLRQYAAEALQEDTAAWEEVWDLHSGYFMTLLCESGNRMNGPGHRAAMETLDTERENLRQAWSWAVSAGRFDRLDQALYGFNIYLTARGQYHELYRQLSLTVEALMKGDENELNQVLLAKALTVQAFIDADRVTARPARKLERALKLVQALGAERQLGLWYAILAKEYGYRRDPIAARQMLSDSLEWLRAAGDDRGLGLAYYGLADVLYILGEYKEAKAAVTEAIALSRRAGDEQGLADNYRILTDLLFQERDPAGAKKVLRDRLELYRSLDDRANSAFTLFQLGRVCLGSGDYAVAVEGFRQMKEMFSEMGVPSMRSTAITWEAITLLRWGDFENARSLHLENLERVRQTGDLTTQVWTHYELGEVERVMGNLDAAEEHYQECARLYEDERMNLVQAFSHKGMGDLELRRGDLEAAQGHFQASLTFALRDYNPWCVAYANHGLGRTAVRRGELEQAAGFFRTAIDQAKKEGDLALILVTLTGMAELLAARGEVERAVEVAAFVAHHSASWQEYRAIAGDLLQRSSAQIPRGRFTAAQERGEAADLEDLLDSFRMS